MVFFETAFRAVAHAFAPALDLQNVPLVAELADSDLDAASDLVLVCEGERADLHDHNLIAELEVLKGKRGAQEWLQGETRKLDTRVFFSVWI